MNPRYSSLTRIERVLAEKRDNGEITAFRIHSSPSGGWMVRVRAIGKELDPRSISEIEDVLRASQRESGVNIDFDPVSQRSIYYLLSQGPRPDSDLLQELRPGSGIIRSVGGVPKGPAGTLTCFLSSDDGSDVYLLAAGHVVTDFWRERPSLHPKGSVYHNPTGFPSTNSTRFIGKMMYSSKPPSIIDNSVDENSAFSARKVDIDAAIVSVVGEFEWKQRTTCYGSFGEWPGEPKRAKKDQIVMKCGSEETHWTYAIVKNESKTVLVYGQGPTLYEFRGQVILSQVDGPTGKLDKGANASYPKAPKASFAVPGDSGTMVVDHATRLPLGMLIAGSILDGKYVMTPLPEISHFWKKKGLTFLRA
jgi:hypothetical protein